MKVTKEEVEIYQKSLERLFPGQKAQSILTASRITASWLTQRELLKEVAEQRCESIIDSSLCLEGGQCLPCRVRQMVSK